MDVLLWSLLAIVLGAGIIILIAICREESRQYPIELPPQLCPKCGQGGVTWHGPTYVPARSIGMGVAPEYLAYECEYCGYVYKRRVAERR